jgi:hypothetical protein
MEESSLLLSILHALCASVVTLDCLFSSLLASGQRLAGINKGTRSYPLGHFCGIMALSERGGREESQVMSQGEQCEHG